MDFKPINDYVPEYWEGRHNILVRVWVYLSTGLDFINQGRYLIIGILGLYAVLRLDSWTILVLMFAISLPILTILGRWKLYKVNKTQEFVATVTSTVLGYNSYNINVENNELLKEIVNQLKCLNNSESRTHQTTSSPQWPETDLNK
jgi:hypothetical protein